MVYKFRLITNELEDFIRDYEVLSDQTFYDFHLIIQDNLHYDQSQLASFFICNKKWEKQQEITLFELNEEENSTVIVMDSARIGDHISQVHEKLLYVFDVFNERVFFMELVSVSDPVSGQKYPVCSHMQGCPPQQIFMDKIFLGKSDNGVDISSESDYLDNLNDDDPDDSFLNEL